MSAYGRLTVTVCSWLNWLSIHLIKEKKRKKRQLSNQGSDNQFRGGFLRTRVALNLFRYQQLDLLLWWWVSATLRQIFTQMVFNVHFLVKKDVLMALYDCQTSEMTFKLLFSGLVESGNKWQARFCSSGLCKEDWLPQSLPGTSLTGSWSRLSCTKATGSGWQVSVWLSFMILLQYHNQSNQPTTLFWPWLLWDKKAFLVDFSFKCL